MSESDCIHGLELSLCHMCKGPPPGIPKTVWVTAGGNHFHSREDCETLDSGQVEASSQGLQTHERRQVGWSEVSDKRSPCRNCCGPNS
jgi:hypothetical protein